MTPQQDLVTQESVGRVGEALPSNDLNTSRYARERRWELRWRRSGIAFASYEESFSSGVFRKQGVSGRRTPGYVAAGLATICLAAVWIVGFAVPGRSETITVPLEGVSIGASAPVKDIVPLPRRFTAHAPSLSKKSTAGPSSTRAAAEANSLGAALHAAFASGEPQPWGGRGNSASGFVVVGPEQSATGRSCRDVVVLTRREGFPDKNDSSLQCIAGDSSDVKTAG